MRQRQRLLDNDQTKIQASTLRLSPPKQRLPEHRSTALHITQFQLTYPSVLEATTVAVAITIKVTTTNPTRRTPLREPCVEKRVHKFFFVLCIRGYIHASAPPPPLPRIEHRQLVSWVLRLVAVDVVLLLAWTLVDTPRSVDIVEVVSGDVGEKDQKK